MSSVADCIACGKNADSDWRKDSLGRVWHPDCMNIMAASLGPTPTSLATHTKAVREERIKRVMIEAMEIHYGWDDKERAKRFKELLASCKFQIHEGGSGALHMSPEVMDELYAKFSYG